MPLHSKANLVIGLQRHFAALLGAMILSSCTSVLHAQSDDEQTDFFEKKIRPVLVERCYKCHSPESKSVKGGLLLHTREAMRIGGETGPAVVPKNLKDSLLIEAIRYESFEMPPDGKLPDNIVADFEKWIELGAPDPRDGAHVAATNNSIDIESGKQFWSFQRPHEHPLPQVDRNEWPHRKIDWFILKRIEEAGLEPTQVAVRRQLIRRVSFDLIGLPPTPAEVSAFVDDASPDAYEKLIERLLASPHYGERWARLWLDVARYAEDQAHIVGNDESLFYPNAYLYRDWVINSMNVDLPYDEFIKQQLAADLINAEDKSNHVALGFLGLGPKYYRRNSPEVMADEWEDRVDTVARGLLGLTVACARCHDHKFDPIETEDYYALAGVFASTDMVNRSTSEVEQETKKDKKGDSKSPSNAIHIVGDGKPIDLNVLIRGDVDSKGPLVPRRFVRVLCSSEPPAFTNGSGRLELAESIADSENPLTARVMVNRIWALHFGKPLVGTPSNFGSLGERPTHPELLDDLAARFMQSGWSLKWLQRELLLSSTYQQSSQSSMQTLATDPSNQWFARMNRRRLSVEAWRDALLASSGQLNDALFGKSIDPQLPDERRRTVYSSVSRFQLNPMLAMFDFPDPNAHAASRSRTTTAIQKLFVLNNAFMIKQAEMLTARLHAEIGDDGDLSQATPIQLAHQLLYARPATQAEMELGLAFLRESGADSTDAWRQYAQALIATNEMLFID